MILLQGVFKSFVKMVTFKTIRQKYNRHRTGRNYFVPKYYSDPDCRNVKRLLCIKLSGAFLSNKNLYTQEEGDLVADC